LHEFPGRFSACSASLRYLITRKHDDAMLFAWDVATARLIHEIDTRKEFIDPLVFLPDGTHLLIGGARRLRLIDLESGTETLDLAEHRPIGRVAHESFSADGKTLCTTDQDFVHVWDVPGRRLVVRFAAAGNSFLSPDGRYLATEVEPPVLTDDSEGSVVVTDARTGSFIRRFRGGVPKFTPDSRSLATTSRHGVVLLWDLASGGLFRELPQQEFFRAVGLFSPAGDKLVRFRRGDLGELSRLWDLKTGDEIPIPRKHVAAFTKDGTRIVVVDEATTNRSYLGLWDLNAGGYVFQVAGYHNPANFLVRSTRESDWVISSRDGGVAFLWDFERGQPIQRFVPIGEEPPMNVSIRIFVRARLSPDGSKLLTQNSTWPPFSLWDTATGVLIRHFEHHGGDLEISPDFKYYVGERDNVRWLTTVAGDRSFVPIGDTNVAFSPQGPRCAVYLKQGVVKVWDLEAAKLECEIPAPPPGDWTLAFAPDGRHLIVADDVWSMQGPSKRFSLEAGSRSIVFAPDARGLAAGSDGGIVVWSVADGVPLRRLPGHRLVLPLDALNAWDRFEGVGNHRTTTSPYLPTYRGGEAPSLELREWERGEIVFTLARNELVESILCAPNGGYALAIGARDGRTESVPVLWDIRNRKRITELKLVANATFSRDGESLLILGDDGVLNIHESRTGRLLCSVRSEDDAWAVVDPAGRFDTADPERVYGLHWVAEDDPFRPLAIDIFMRDFLEPQLLAKTLDNNERAILERRPPPVIATLNRVQPIVGERGLRLRTDRVKGQSDLIRAIVPVAGVPRQAGRPGEATSAAGTGVYDLRLFRDGQLVGQAPQLSTESAPPLLARAGADLERWRTRTPVCPEDGIAEVAFQVRLPRSRAGQSVELSAYAFNRDRVRSAVARQVVPVPRDVGPATRRAFLITFGASAFENPTWNLNFADDDARELGKALQLSLQEAGEFDQVRVVPLISDYNGDPRTHQYKVTERGATRRRLETVLGQLAGQRLAPAAGGPAALPDLSRGLPAATPDDLVLLLISTHGITAPDGTFYLLPYDVGRDAPGRGQVGETARLEDLLRRCITSDDLARWLRGVDAGEIVLLLDTCQSAGSVAPPGYKHGPFGSRGLGQLAYDKGMRVLAASQFDRDDYEPPVLGHGLLVYALIEEGLYGRATAGVTDAGLTLGRLLAQASRRLPELQRKWWLGDRAVVPGRPVRVPATNRERAALVGIKRPVLFDFSRSRRDVKLARLAPRRVAPRRSGDRPGP
jgi:WD40 repeat protein